MSPAEPLRSLLADRTLLIFDFDGTVADTSPLHATAFEQVLAPLGVSVDYAKIAGMKTADAMRVLLQGEGVQASTAELTELVEAKQRTVRTMIKRGLKPLNGVDDFLRWARGRYRLSLATSGSTATVTLALEALGYLGWFNPVVCAEDVVHAKPAPDAFLRVLATTDTLAPHALVFEDSEAGFMAAVAANITWCDARQVLHDNHSKQHDDSGINPT